VGSYQSAIAAAKEALTDALMIANEYRFVPDDQRREVSELTSRIGMLAEEAGRLR
jgi:hypothetical protein